MVLLQVALRRRPIADTAGLEARALAEAARSDWQTGDYWMMDTPLTVKAELAAIRHDARTAVTLLNQEQWPTVIYALTERPRSTLYAAIRRCRGFHNPAAERTISRSMLPQ